MEANLNTQKAGGEKPSLFGMVTSPGLQFERMKMSEKVWGMFFLMALFQGLLSAFTTYVTNTSPEMVKIKKELGEFAGQSSLTSDVIYGIVSGTIGGMLATFVVAAIYKVFMMFYGNDTPYKKLVTIIVYTNVVVISGGFINGVIALFLGVAPTAYTITMLCPAESLPTKRAINFNSDSNCAAVVGLSCPNTLAASTSDTTLACRCR